MNELAFRFQLAALVAASKRSRRAIAEDSGRRGGVGSDTHIRDMENGTRGPPEWHRMPILADALHLKPDERLSLFRAAVREHQAIILALSGPPLRDAQVGAATELVMRWSSLDDETLLRLTKVLGERR